MLLKSFFLSLGLMTSSSANSKGWPAKDLPESIKVAIDIPFTWEAESVAETKSCFRVHIFNQSQKELELLNVSFNDVHFTLIKDDGSEVRLDTPIQNLDSPMSNPGLTLGVSSQVGFKVEMDRSKLPPNLEKGTVALDVTIRFVAGNIMEARNGRPGILDGFTYTVTRRLVGADRLLK